jgi:hypothetical protein
VLDCCFGRYEADLFDRVPQVERSGDVVEGAGVRGGRHEADDVDEVGRSGGDEGLDGRHEAVEVDVAN